MRHGVTTLILILLSQTASALDFPPKPQLPTPPSIPGNIPGVGGGGDSQPAADTEKKPSYIYQYYNDPGDIALNFAKLSEDQCIRIIAKAKVLIKTEEIYQEKKADAQRMAGSVHSLKGFILEELYFTSDDFAHTLTQAKETAAKEGIAAEQVVLARDTFGRMPVEDATADAGNAATADAVEEKLSGWNELTDGMIVAILERPVGASDETLAEFDARVKQFESAGAKPGFDRYIRILAVIESKTPRENVKLAQGSKGKPGQLSKDYGRLTSYPLKVGDQTFEPGQILISRTGTSWTAVLPRDYRTSFGDWREHNGTLEPTSEKAPASFKGIFTRYDRKMEEFDFRLNEGPVSNTSAKLIAENVFQILYEKKFFSEITPRVEE